MDPADGFDQNGSEKDQDEFLATVAIDVIPVAAMSGVLVQIQETPLLMQLSVDGRLIGWVELGEFLDQFRVAPSEVRGHVVMAVRARVDRILAQLSTDAQAPGTEPRTLSSD
jgi:hypothetical protein